MQYICNYTFGMSSSRDRTDRFPDKLWGTRLRHLRHTRGPGGSKLSLEDAAEKLGVGLKSLSAYELGNQRIPYEVLQRAAEAFGVPIWYFFEEAPADVTGDHRVVEFLARWERMEEHQRSTLWSLIRPQLDLVDAMKGGARQEA